MHHNSAQLKELRGKEWSSHVCVLGSTLAAHTHTAEYRWSGSPAKSHVFWVYVLGLEAHTPKHMGQIGSLSWVSEPDLTMKSGRISLWKVAGSHYEKWSDLTMKSGRISLWKVAGSHYKKGPDLTMKNVRTSLWKVAGSHYEKWPDLTMKSGRISLWKVAGFPPPINVKWIATSNNCAMNCHLQ